MSRLEDVGGVRMKERRGRNDADDYRGSQLLPQPEWLPLVSGHCGPPQRSGTREEGGRGREEKGCHP